MIVEAATKHAVLLTEARRIEAEIKRLQGALQRPARRLPLIVELSPAEPIPRTVAAPAKEMVPAPAAVADKDKKERSRPARKRSAEAAASSHAASGPAAPSAPAGHYSDGPVGLARGRPSSGETGNPIAPGERR